MNMKEWRYYRLEDHQVVPCPDVEIWAIEQNDEDRHLVAETVIGDTEVRTVFFGIDASEGRDERPSVFVTKILWNDKPIEHHFYATWEEAETGHREVCERIAKQAAPRQ